MSIAIVTLVNVSSPSETIFIKELTLNILPNEEVFITEQFQYVQINSAFSISILDAVNNDKVLVKIDGVLQSKVDSIAYLTAPSIPGSGEANTASNVGGGSGVFKQKTGVDLELRSMVAGSNMTITETADEITFDASGGSGEVNTASNLGAGEGVFAQKTAQDLEFKSLVAGSGISLASTATELTVTSTSAGIPLVDDDAARDAAYPTPTNNLQVFNKRQGLIETYNSFYDLWISAGMNVCVEDSTVQVVAPQKAVYIVPTAATIGGVEFPVLGYTSASAERNVTQGVVTRRGAATANPNQTYIAVHHFGVYYVDYGAAVTIGFNVYPRTVGVGDVIGAAFAQSGTIGQAIENSGSNPSFPNSVLVSLQQRR